MTNALEVVRGLYAAYQRGALDAILASFAEDAAWDTGYPPGMPLGRVFSGRGDIATFVQLIGECLEFHGYEPREFVAQEDTVVVLGWERVTARPTGRTYENPWVHVWTVEHGKVRKVRGFNDTAAIVRGFALEAR